MPIPAAVVGMEDRAVDDPALEFKLCVAAIPVALALGVAFHILTPSLQRIFLAMPIHELGHAVTAWFCGYFAVPTLWRTLLPEEHGWSAAAMVRRYVAVGVACLAALGLVYAWGVRLAWRKSIRYIRA